MYLYKYGKKVLSKIDVCYEKGFLVSACVAGTGMDTDRLFGAAGLAWSIDFVVWYTPDGKMQQVSDLLGGWIDEVIVIGLMAGLLLVAFSRERDEDEYTTRLRASSLVWAVLADSLFVLLATCFLYEFAYLYALFLQLFLLLVLYIVKFRTAVWRAKREARKTGI